MELERLRQAQSVDGAMKVLMLLWKAALQRLRPTSSSLLAIAWIVSPSYGAIRGSVATTSGDAPTSSGIVVQLWMLNALTQVYEFKESQGAGSWNSYRFSFNNVNRGTYKLACQDLSGTYAVQYAGGSPYFDDADTVAVDSQSHEVTANFALAEGKMLSGSVRNEAGQPLAHIDLSIFAVEEGGLKRYVTGFPTDMNGDWKIGVPAGIYVILFKDLFDDGFHYAAQWFDNAASEESASFIDVSATLTSVTGIDAVLKLGRRVSGAVFDRHGAPIKGLFVTALSFDNFVSSWETVFVTKTGAGGEFSAILPAGQYRFFFQEGSMLFEHEYWDNSQALDDSAVIDLINSDIGGLDVQMDYSPLALWAFRHGLDPLVDAGGWLRGDADHDGYSNFEEFAFGTDPNNAASGYPYFLRTAGSTLSLSALVNTNTSTAYSLTYELQECSDLVKEAWLTSPKDLSPTADEAPAGYTRIGVSLPTLLNQKQFYRVRAAISPQ